MKAAIALLANYQTQNIARRMVFEMSQRGEIQFFGSLLPSHVSLKQPFTFEDMERLEAWFDALAAKTPAVDIQLGDVYYSEWEGHAIVGMEVVETPVLRALHNLINRELPGVVLDPAAPHDGDSYRFHLTVEIGPAGAGNPLKVYYDGLLEKRVGLRFTATHLALFYYASRSIASGSFILYRVMPLGAG